MEKVTTVGIDWAKNVFSLHAVYANGKVALKRTVRTFRVEWPGGDTSDTIYYVWNVRGI